MKKIFCFGEILLRMSPAINGEWIKESSMAVHVGGAELNVANALAKWTVPVEYCSAAPDNYLSKEIIADLQQKNIDTTPFIFSGTRIGIYFLAQGTDLKHAGVIYDRAHSSFSELKPGTIDWDEKLKHADWFHFSAISPALSEQTAILCKEAVEAAARKKIIISVDLNYRSKLWQYGKKPVDIMPELVQHCDIIMGNIWSANDLLNINLDKNIHAKNNKESYLQHALLTADAIRKEYAKCVTVANTFRFDSGDGVKYYASLNDETGQYVSKEFYINRVIDKVGSGDCFMAGIIYSKLNNYSPQQTINFAASAAIGKMAETGDATKQSVDDILKRITV